ncbi:hypothetical protein PVK06_019778 [Gossypium arboreum]|uniref:Uncharacterized protein n=1 Tax=Gossypium arboreum TaxID=29729 RepID=A0ABR0PL59_GOSAR|nr:hypothetical protein PVK06_019778 [Gossypium arboreum]
MDVICQETFEMGKIDVFVLSTLQQIEPVAGQAAALVLCHTRELVYQLRVFQFHFITEFILTKYYFLYPLTEFPSSTTAESCFGAAIKNYPLKNVEGSLASCPDESVVYEGLNFALLSEVLEFLVQNLAICLL